jgi:hypothetical protein
MTQVSRRTFGKQTVLFSVFAALSIPGKAMAFLDKIEKKQFLKRDDIQYAMKSLFITYDGTSKYLHKFNDVVTKTQLRSLQFHINKGLDKEYVDHYISTMEPVLQRIKQMVETEGTEKGLSSLFEDNPSAYQLFERINVNPNQRSFPCPYKEMLQYCEKYLKTFPMPWEDVCSRWCTPTWKGFAEKIGINVSVHPGATCEVKLISQS